MKFFDAEGRNNYRRGRLVFCKPDSQESFEWAPSQFTTRCKPGEELKIVQLDDAGGCADDAFSSIPGPCVILLQDWNGVTQLHVNKG